MARIDKYDPISGGFRAPLAAAYTGSGTPLGVGLNSSGRVVAGGGNTGILGVVTLPGNHEALSPVDVMTDGELVEFAGAAGTIYYADNTTGVISATGGVGKTRIGATVEATRLVVRMDRGDASAATDVVGDQPAIAQVASANASDLASAITLVNEIKTKFNTLLTEVGSTGAGVLL